MQKSTSMSTLSLRSEDSTFASSMIEVLSCPVSHTLLSQQHQSYMFSCSCFSYFLPFPYSLFSILFSIMSSITSTFVLVLLLFRSIEFIISNFCSPRSTNFNLFTCTRCLYAYFISNMNWQSLT